MPRIAIVFHSGGGRTARLAEAIAGGVEQVPHTMLSMHRVTAGQIDERGRWKDPVVTDAIAESDGVIFGTPTLMGMVSAPFKAFMEGAFFPWAGQGWKDKFAGGFTHSGSLNGDKTNTQIQLVVFAAQMGMMWVPMGDHPGNNWTGGGEGDLNRLGSFLGPMSQGTVDVPISDAMLASDLTTGERYGQRFASIVSHWTRDGDHLTERTFDLATRAALAT